MIIFGYFLILIFILSFMRYPRYGLYVALVTKPTLDLFWWSKSEGYISPLFIAGIGVPLLAVLGLSRIKFDNRKLPIDRIVIAYLLSLILLTVLKIINEPDYIFNSIESLVRHASVTVFYFFGRFYFQDSKSRESLILITILSVAVPFILTIGQGVLGIDIQSFSDVYVKGMDTNAVSAYYLGGRHDLLRISGLYEGVYELAFMGGITLIIIFSMFEAKNYRVKFWQLLLMICGAYLFYFTYSRSAWVSVYITVLLFFFIQRKIQKVALIIGGAILLYLTVQTVQYRFEDELGFFLGESDFNQFGYSRGGKWLFLLKHYFEQDFISQLIGNYGNGNPENQFLGMLFWWGYIGLAIFIIMILIFTKTIYSQLKKLGSIGSVEAKVTLMFGCFIIASYWFAGNGNMFPTMITTQWFIWTWTGVIITGYSERVERVAHSSRRYSSAELSYRH